MNWYLEETIDLHRPAGPISKPNLLMVNGDSLAHVWRITVLEGSEPATLTGCTATGYFVRSDGETVMCRGTISGSVVTVTLQQAVYAVPGSIMGMVRLTAPGGSVMTLSMASWIVRTGETAVIVDPEHIVPDLSELLQRLQEMADATERANAAAAACEVFTDSLGKPAYTTTDGIYVNDTGIERSSSAYFATDYIPVDVCGVMIRTKTNNDYSRTVFFDRNKAVLGAESMYAHSEQWYAPAMPEGAAFVRISCLQAYRGSFDVMFHQAATALTPLASSLRDAAEVAAAQLTGGAVELLPDAVNAGKPWVLDPNSMSVYTADAATFNGCAPIDIRSLQPGTALTIRVSVLSAYGAYICDEHLTALAYINGNNAAEHGVTPSSTAQAVTLTVPTGAAWLVADRRAFGEADAQPEAFATQATGAGLMQRVAELEDVSYWATAMWRVLCIGDSLTSGASPEEEWGAEVGVSIDENYPRILGRMINGEVTNGGFSGSSASSWYERRMSGFDLHAYDTYIIWLGTNNSMTPDSLDTAGSEANYYCRIIDAIRAANPSPLIILCTVFASATSASSTNAAIYAIAARYGLPVVDMRPLNHKSRPELHCNQTGNPHFGKAGNIVIARTIIDTMGAWFREDPLRCEYGKTPRTN